MYKLGINFDEISDSLDVSLDIVKQLGLKYGELRTLDGKNFCFWTKEDLEHVKQTLIEHAVQPVAVASPIFKWYVSNDDPEVEHDSYGFNARLSDEEKRTVIKDVLKNAKYLSIPIIRIFSGLGKNKDAVKTFLADPMLAYALELAEDLDIYLCVENEPVCHIYTKQQLIELFAANTHPRMRLWLDVANLIRIGDVVDEELLSSVGDAIIYVHVKDYITKANDVEYVPVGSGEIDYPKTLSLIAQHLPDQTFVTIETHAPQDLKQAYSERSIVAMQEMLRRI